MTKKIIDRAMLSASVAPMAISLALLGSASAAAQTAAPVAGSPSSNSNCVPGAPGCLPQDASGDTSGSQEIVVTGSRIASPTLTSPSPIQIVDAKQIQNTGFANLQEVLLENPVFGTPGISRTNSNFSTSSAGVATVDLRNLGADRTLVLVDGRRFVAGVPGTSTVDFNDIPAQFIDRVDILTGGASAIYGSDAVAGVVNIIYKKNFEGVEASGQYGLSSYGDDVSKQANIMIGGNFGDGRGNVMIYGGYTKEGAVYSRDRDRSAVDQISTGYAITGNDSDLFTATRPFYSSYAPQGRITAGSTVFSYDNNGNLVTSPSTNGTATKPALGFNRSAYRTIAIPTDRYLFAARAHYDVDDHASVFLEGTYASTHVVTQIEPFPLASGTANGPFPATGGFFPIEGYAVNPATNASTLTRNPLVPIAIYNAATDQNGDGLRDVSFTRRLADFGNRGSSVDRDTFRIVTGLNGQIAGDWHYEVYYDYGQTRESQLSNGQVNLLNFANALNAVQDVYDLNGNGSTTDAICANQQARAQGCVPADVFNGANKISPAAVQYITAGSTLISLTRQEVAALNITGTAIDLPAGPLGVAVGLEYRKEHSEQIFDALTNAGLNGGNALQNTSGGFNVKEAYGEVEIPILADKPFFHALSARAAGRYSDYSTVGHAYSYNYGGEWAPFADLTLKGIRAQATRAPNIGELFGGSGQTYPTGLNDPCVGVTATSTGTLGSRCRAATGVNANIAANGGVFTANQSDIQGVSGVDTSNPKLKAEISHSWTFYATLNPRSIHALRNLVISVDYFDIKIKKAIERVPRQFTLDQCYTGDQSYCQFITRYATAVGASNPGALNLVNSTLNNSGGERARGFDVTAAYRQDLESLGLKGSLNFNAAWTHVISEWIIPLPGAGKDEINREIGASRNKINGNVDYSVGRFTMSVRGQYIGPAYLDDQFTGFTAGTAPAGEPSNIYEIKSKFYTDLQVRVRAGDNFEFYVGANNVFNVAPPPVISGLPGDTTGAETDAGTYDAIGRRLYTGIRMKF